MRPVHRIYLDTNILITLIEKTDITRNLLVDLIGRQPPGMSPIFTTSELSLSELLVKPYRQKDETLMGQYDSLIVTNDWLEVRAVDRSVLYNASVLRAEYSYLRLPDAIHLSSAISQDCSHVLTGDLGIKDEYAMDSGMPGVSKRTAFLSILRPDEPTLTSLIESLRQ